MYAIQMERSHMAPDVSQRIPASMAPHNKLHGCNSGSTSPSQSADYTPSSSAGSSGIQLPHLQLHRNTDASACIPLTTDIARTPELARTASPTTPPPAGMASAAIHALLNSQNHPQVDHPAQSFLLGDAPNARLLQTSQPPPTNAGPTSMLHASGLLDQLADGSIDNARLAALIRAAAELYSTQQDNASSPMASLSFAQSGTASQAPARSEYTQATQASAAMQCNGQVANLGNLVQAQQQVLPIAAVPSMPSGQTTSQWPLSSTELAEQLLQQLSLANPSNTAASYASCAPDDYSIASTQAAFAPSSAAPTMAAPTSAPEWLFVPNSSAPHGAVQQLVQPQMLQQQAQLVQQQPQQLMLVTSPSASQAPQQPQLLQMPAGAELQGAQVMYVPAQYVLVPAGSTAPSHTATSTTTPATMLVGPQPAYQALPQMQRQMQRPVQRQAQARGAASPVIPTPRVFVGNLHTQVTEVELGMMFSGIGRVLCSKVMYNSRRMSRPRSQWRSREFGFVDFSTPAEAQRAIARLHGAVLPGLTKDGSQLIVQYVKADALTGGQDSMARMY